MPETPEKAATATVTPKSSPTKKEIDAATEALNNFAQGKRHLIVGDIPNAVNSLQEACKLLADQYGETAPECGDAYFCYGKALLEMARLESGVLGNALEGVPEGDDADNSQVENPEKLTDTEKSEVTELVHNALEENFESLEEMKKANKSSLVNGHCNGEVVNGGEVDLEKKKKGSQDGKLDEKTETMKDKAPDTEAEPKQKDGSTENEDEDSEEADAESQGGESQDGEDGESPAEGEGETKEAEEKEEVEGDKTEEEEEEVTNLQLAWEMLELAKVIFQKQEDTLPKMKGKVAEVYLKLGEVGLESENYPQGIEDFKHCLDIQKKVLVSDDRCIAETHYQLGIAYSFCDEFDLAIGSFSGAVNVLETRIVNLNKIMKEKANWTEKQRMEDAATKPDPFYTEQGEIDELNQLLPEMKEKIVDMKQMKKDSIDRLKVAKDTMLSNLMGGESSEGGSTSQSAFGAPQSSSSSQSAFGAPSTSSSAKEAKPIMVVRKKQRKLEEVGGGDDVKSVKGESGDARTAALSGSKVANGQAENTTQGKEGANSKSTTVEELKGKAAEEMKKSKLQSAS